MVHKKKHIVLLKEIFLKKGKFQMNFILMVVVFVVLLFNLFQIYRYYYTDDYYEELFEKTYCSVIDEGISDKVDSSFQLSSISIQPNELSLQRTTILPMNLFLNSAELTGVKIPNLLLNSDKTVTKLSKLEYKQEKVLKYDDLLAVLLKGESSEEVLNEFKPSILPVDSQYATIGSSFGTRRHPILNISKLHEGVDFDSPYGANVYAAGSGVVRSAGWLKGYGKLVCIQHIEKLESRYAHLSTLLVKAGDVVHRGDLIGKVGNTGLSTTAHLHFEVRKNGKALNPVLFLQKAK